MPVTRANLHGVWVAIATPWDADNRFDERRFRENVRRLAATGVHGAYTTDSDGEFYAVEFDDYRRIVDALAEEAQRTGFATQVGVTWFNTHGVIARLEHAASQGILGAHVGHPPFMDMTPASLSAFWSDVTASVPDTFGLVHYNSPRMPNVLGPASYQSLAASIPNLVGTKQVTADFFDFASIVQCAPDLAHFTGEQTMTPFMLFGARGVYSWLANFNPFYMLAWYNDCRSGRWEQARVRQERVLRFIRLKRAVFGADNRYGVVNKAVAAASPFLGGGHRTRPPYLPVPQAAVDTFRARVATEFPDFLEGL